MLSTDTHLIKKHISWVFNILIWAKDVKLMILFCTKRVYLLMGDISYIVELLQFLNSYKECKLLLFSQTFHLDFIYK